MAIDILNETADEYNKVIAAKSLPAACGYGLNKLYSKYGYTVAAKLFVEPGTLLSMNQVKTLNRSNAVGVVTTVCEIALNEAANHIDNPTLKTGCQCVAKATGLSGQVYNGVSVGNVIGGPVGAAIGGVVSGAVWTVTTFLTS